MHRSHLWHQLPTLAGKRLACDCEWHEVCEADALAGLCFDATSPSPSGWKGATGRSHDHAGVGRVVLTSTLAHAQATPVPPQLWKRSQESVILQFQKLFPGDWFSDFAFPMIEDLVNQPPFTCFEQWLRERGAEWDGALGPALAPGAVRLKQRSTEGKQSGAYNQKAALPPVVSYGLTPDQHFEQALHVGQSLLPTEYPAVLDADLHFAADVCRSHRGHLRELRTRAMGMLRELHRRWQPVTRHLRQFQPNGIKQVTSKRDLGFTSILIVLSSWPDVTYPYGLIKGLPAVGYAPCYGIFPELKVDRISFEEVMGDWQGHNHEILSSLRPGPDDEFLLQQSCVDADKGFCTYPMTHSELRSALHGEPFRLIPRCVITQSSGKQRVIDDAFRGGQSGTSRDANKLVLCSPLRPAQHIQTLLQGSGRKSSQLRERQTPWKAGVKIGLTHIDIRRCLTLRLLIVLWFGGIPIGKPQHSSSIVVCSLASR